MQLRMPALFWGARVTNARVLGAGRVQGHAAEIVSFFDPTIRGWFTLWIDPHNAYTLKLTLIAASHFMHHRYTDFNRVPPIRPPQTG